MIRSIFAYTVAAAALAFLAPHSATAQVVFSESFESPAVSGYGQPSAPSGTVSDVIFTLTGTNPLNLTATIPASKSPSCERKNRYFSRDSFSIGFFFRSHDHMSILAEHPDGASCHLLT